MRHVTRLAVALCVGAIAVASLGASAFAQTAPAQEDTGYDAKGLPLGGFRLFPSLLVGVDYDDNVYRTDTNAKSDYYFRELPAFTLQSQWGLHELDLYGALASYQYSSLTHEDHIDGTIGGNGRLDILRGIDLIGGLSYAVQHESRNSPDQLGFAKSPTRYELTRGNAAFEYHPYQFDFTLGGSYAHYNYDPTQLIGFPPQNNDDRDRDEYEYYARGAYEFSPGYAVYVQAGGRDVHYDQKFDRNGFQRDNNGYSINAGLDMSITHLIQGQVFVGYLDQQYRGTLPDISGLNFGANIDWFATPLWTFHLTASRVLNGTTIAGASAEDDQSVRLTADFQPQPNLIFAGYVGYLDENFNGSPRDDRYTSAGISLQYLLNHNMSLQGGYDYQIRDSTIPGQDFNDNHVFVALNFQL